GRPGSRSELDGWTAQMAPDATALSAAVVSGIHGSPEARDHLVRGWYLAFLGRQANGTEELGWVNLLLSGQSEEPVLSMILSDPHHEFYDRAQALVSSGTPDERFVTALYGLLLDRAPGGAEAADAVTALKALGGQAYALSVLQSQELRTDRLEGYYDVL